MARAIDQLTNPRSADLFEAYEVRTFRAYRNTKDGGVHAVAAEILDSGPRVERDLRYSCMSTADDGSTAVGNHEASLETALAVAPWSDLDQR